MTLNLPFFCTFQISTNGAVSFNVYVKVSNLKSQIPWYWS